MRERLHAQTMLWLQNQDKHWAKLTTRTYRTEVLSTPFFKLRPKVSSIFILRGKERSLTWNQITIESKSISDFMRGITEPEISSTINST
jgi:hypothetical protein